MYVAITYNVYSIILLCIYISLRRAAQTAFFFYIGSGKKWSVAIGDHYVKKISVCEPLAFNTFLCTAPIESALKSMRTLTVPYIILKDRHVDFQYDFYVISR